MNRRPKTLTPQPNLRLIWFLNEKTHPSMCGSLALDPVLQRAEEVPEKQVQKVSETHASWGCSIESLRWSISRTGVIITGTLFTFWFLILPLIKDPWPKLSMNWRRSASTWSSRCKNNDVYSSFVVSTLFISLLISACNEAVISLFVSSSCIWSERSIWSRCHI